MISDSDLKHFIENRSVLDEMKHLPLRKTNKFCGLRNYGATCYLNSLLQLLFHTLEFQRLILQCTDTPNSPIVSELKKLFARMNLSNRLELDTEPLLTAFGWAKSQLFEQHDIHEFFSVLFDALSKESPSLKDGISSLFQGRISGTTHALSFNC